MFRLEINLDEFFGSSEGLDEQEDPRFMIRSKFRKLKFNFRFSNLQPPKENAIVYRRDPEPHNFRSKLSEGPMNWQSLHLKPSWTVRTSCNLWASLSSWIHETWNHFHEHYEHWPYEVNTVKVCNGVKRACNSQKQLINKHQIRPPKTYRNHMRTFERYRLESLRRNCASSGCAWWSCTTSSVRCTFRWNYSGHAFRREIFLDFRNEERGWN